MTNGCYVITDLNEETQEFQYGLRTGINSADVPKKQRDVIAWTVKVYGLADDILEESDKQRQLTAIINAFSSGAVQDNADPDGAITALKNIEKGLLDDLDSRLSDVRRTFLWWLLAWSAFLIVAALTVRGNFDWIARIEATLSDVTAVEISNYFLLLFASSVAVLVADFFFGSASDLETFRLRRERFNNPVLTILILNLLTLFTAILLSAGLISLKINNLSSDSIDSNATVALGLGFLLGLLETDLAKFLLRRARSSLR